MCIKQVKGNAASVVIRCCSLTVMFIDYGVFWEALILALTWHRVSISSLLCTEQLIKQLRLLEVAGWSSI